MRTILLILGALLLISCGYRKIETGNPASIADFKRLRAAAPKAPLLMEVRGVVTFADYLSDSFIIQDSTGGLLVSLSKGHTVAEVGKVVVVSGRFPDANAPNFFQESSVVILHDQVLPSAIPVRTSDPDISEKFYRRVVLEGIVRSPTLLRPGLGSFILKSGNTDVPVSVVLAGVEDIESLLDSKVLVTGVLLKRSQGSHTQMEIWAPELRTVRILQAANPASSIPASNGVPVIRIARAVHGLSADQANMRHPVEFNAVVTYFDRAPNILFVQDKTDGIFVRLRSAGVPSLRPGDLVHVTGFTHPGQFAPIVTSARVVVIGSARLPEPQHDLEAAFMGERDSEWVELRGVVQSVEQAPSTVVATIVWGKHSFKAHIQASLRQVAALIDREVSIRGVCGPVFNRNRQGLGIGLWVPALSFISPESPAVADPFHLPLRPAASLLQFSRAFDFQHRSRIRGQVTLATQTGPTWISDGSQGLEIVNHNALNLREGDIVDAVGFPGSGNFGPVLNSAMIRKLGSGPPPVPVEIEASDAARGHAESQLIRLEATLLGEYVRDGSDYLRFQSGPEVFTAAIPDETASPALPEGTKVRVTGICSMNADDSQGMVRARGFQLSLRSAADITMKAAPWLTMERLAFLLTVTLALVGAALIWVFLLRRNVRVQTRMLMAKSSQLEAAHVSTRKALARAREAEALEQSRRRLLEMVANDDSLDTIFTELARSVEKHSPRVICSLNVQLSNGASFVLPPSESVLSQIESVASPSNSRVTIPVFVDGSEVGVITMHSLSDSGMDAEAKSLFPSWSQFVSLALERRKLYDTLSYRAQFDALTGLHNRAALHERLTAELRHAKRDGTMLALLYMDLNGFKKINDTFGHDAGDVVLWETARRIQDSVRQSDFGARIGGDEFVVLLTGIPARGDAERIGSLLRASLGRPIQSGARSFDCGVSLGLAIFPGDGESAEVLLKQADQNMYAEKAVLRGATSSTWVESGGRENVSHAELIQ